MDNITVYGFESKLGWYWCDCTDEEFYGEFEVKKKWTFRELCEVNKPLLASRNGLVVYCNLGKKSSYGPLPLNYNPLILEKIENGPLPLPHKKSHPLVEKIENGPLPLPHQYY